MTELPILFVAGLGRCGTTMAMTMLDAGGFPVTGPRPAYELPDHWRAGRPDMDWLRDQHGRAVKWIDPTLHFTLPGRLTVRPVIVLMTRRAREQARSQVKLLGGRDAGLGRRAENAVERSIRRDMPVMRAQLRGSAIVHELAFEDVLENPWWAARSVGRLLGRHFDADFDAETAASVVIARDPACADGFAMESMILPVIAADLAKRAEAVA